MKILDFAVRNVLKISELDLSMDGRNLVLIGGQNGQGKSSALKALAMALCGKQRLGDQWPDIALKEGEDRGSVTVRLSGDEELHDSAGFTVEFELRRKRGGVVVESMRLLDSTGEEAAEPRALLNSLYSMNGFDPLSFEKSKPKDRAELLRQLMGLDFSELDEQRKTAYAERTVINREGVSKKSQLDDVIEQCHEFKGDIPAEEVSVRELFSQLEEAQTYNRKTASAVEAAKEASDRAVNQFNKLFDEEKRLRERLEQLKTELVDATSVVRETETVLDKAGAAQKIDESSIQEQIRSADTVNQAVRLKARRDELDAEVKKLQAASQKLTDRLSAIDEEKQERLASAKWPLPGLSLDESGVLLDGLPFEQASKAQRVMASVKIGMAMNPKLRLLISQDGNDLDDDTLTALADVLEQNDFQMLLEFVTRTAEDEARCAVVFHDGTAQQPPSKAAAEKHATVADSEDKE